MTELILESVQAVRSGKPLTEPVSAAYAPGSICSIVGPNGAGKSSLLSAIAGTGVPTRGGVWWEDELLCRMPARKRARVLSFLAQDSTGTAELRVHELVEIGARAGGARSLADARERALDEVGILHLAQRRLGTLSGGQRQLAQLARVVAQDTPLVLLDEPAAALDLAHQVAIENIVTRLAARGRIVLAAVHDLGFALTVSTDVLALEPGGQAILGAPHDVLTPDLLHRLYGVRTEMLRTSGGRYVLVADDRTDDARLPAAH